MAAAGGSYGQSAGPGSGAAGGSAAAPAPAAVPGAPAPVAPAAALGSLRFAQITDAHIFDAGYKCSGDYVQREYQENLAALRWSMDEINRRWKNGERIDFVVFTGDLGIANLAGAKAEHPAPGASSKCTDADDAASSYGPIKQMDFASAEALLANDLNDLPQGVPVYFVPGNNDLTDEDPASLGRYGQFVSELKVLTHGRVADLNARSVPVRGYTLVGLDSAGFKPQAYTDGTANEDTVHSSTVKTAGSGFYCEDLDDATAGPRAKEKAKEIQSFAGMVSGPGTYLVFTHEPDLQDPYLPRRENANTASGGTCEFASTWLLTKSARAQWQASGLNNPKILGIFAGHFHSARLSDYGGPQKNDALAKTNPGPAGSTPVGIYVTPPISVKNQWDEYPDGARGMSFVTVKDGHVDEQLDLYWPKSGGNCCGQDRSQIVSGLLEPFHDEPEIAFVAAAVLTLLLVAIILGLASTLDPQCPKARPGKNWIHTAFNWIGNRVVCCKSQFLKLLIEGDTQSYSLSKLQFLLWTVATVYGYTYLWIAHSWVQGLPGLPDVTGKFPWETLLAGGTAVASQVSKQAFGTKGGGPLKPQLSDLISAGGVIASGRIQFLSWTLVAITAYLASILASDPTTIQLLPQIPERLLDISGISAVAYLAARSVSSAGPLLTSAVFNRGATPVPVPPPVPPPPGGKGTVGPAAPPPGGDGPKVLGELLLIGDSLSKNATLQAFEANPQTADSGHSQAPGTAAGAGTKDCVSGVDGVPIAGFKYGPPPFLVDEKDGVPGKPGMYTRMTVNILCDCFPAKWTVRVTNPDGKYAEAEVAMHQLPPESKDAQKADPVDVADGAKPDAPESKDAQPDAPVDVPDKEAPPTS